VILDLLRHAGQRPVQPCRGKVDAAHIGIRVGVIEAIRARADDTTINDR
jgi:NOL1/NOP2/fmu family ribosome biogenesis protein